jgi:DNA-binding response OmpR family regulator
VAEVLLVEDDPEIRRALIRTLTDRGHAVRSEANGLSGLQAILHGRPELVILDLGLPDVDGADLLSMVRSVSQVPIIVVTARADQATVVDLLRKGADDYVTKPFGSDELDARIGAVLRRVSAGQPAAAPPVVVGDLQIDVAGREATLAGERLDLTPREFDLLSYLASRAGAVVTRRELLTQVWRQAFGGPDDTIDVHLSWLRRKLGESAQEPRYLHTVRGVGVKLSPPSDDAATT